MTPQVRCLAPWATIRPGRRGKRCAIAWTCSWSTGSTPGPPRIGPRFPGHRCELAPLPGGRDTATSVPGCTMVFVSNMSEWNYLFDMDGVLVREEHLITGADALIAELRERGTPFMVLTNNSIYTPRDLRARLLNSGLDIPEESIWTSALATAQFLQTQRPGGSAYVVGESGLTTALHNVGYVMTERNPDYVVLGETRTYSFEAITRAIRLVRDGARFIATNPDETGPSAQGPLPATGAVAALIERATGRHPYFVGKPNPLMMRSALRRIGAHPANTLMVGDRIDREVLSGLEAGLQTVLVLSGISGRETAEQFPYRPTRVIESVKELVGVTHDPFGAGRREKA